jgi:hypothetical protein
MRRWNRLFKMAAGVCWKCFARSNVLFDSLQVLSGKGLLGQRNIFRYVRVLALNKLWGKVWWIQVFMSHLSVMGHSSVNSVIWKINFQSLSIKTTFVHLILHDVIHIGNLRTQLIVIFWPLRVSCHVTVQACAFQFYNNYQFFCLSER